MFHFHMTVYAKILKTLKERKNEEIPTKSILLTRKPFREVKKIALLCNAQKVAGCIRIGFRLKQL